MNIKPLLVRLQNAIGRDDLMEQMVLLREPKTPLSEQAQGAKSVNLVVGYNNSPKSQTALDISLLIAHQTHLATKAQVTVQVVYVVENDDKLNVNANVLRLEKVTSASSRNIGTNIINQTTLQPYVTYQQNIIVDKFAQAERILRQASYLAEEWKSSFKAHLRFGCVATEIKKVVGAQRADLLLLGCQSAEHPIIQKLGFNLPCPVLGIPSFLED